MAETKYKKPITVLLDLPAGISPEKSIFTLYPDLRPEMVSYFVNKLIFDPAFADEFSKDPVPHLKKLGIELSTEVKEKLAKIDVKMQFEEMRPNVSTEQLTPLLAIAAVLVAAIAPSDPAF